MLKYMKTFFFADMPQSNSLTVLSFFLKVNLNRAFKEVFNLPYLVEVQSFVEISSRISYTSPVSLFRTTKASSVLQLSSSPRESLPSEVVIERIRFRPSGLMLIICLIQN
ncbi:hypothetical protein THRCLA_21468 [Thraustotheca clavata]|uniref:Uncharacterized protein n=1 Tax=Thraustotheca clavata TaxID=74557 RepID=A0A1V9ZWC2_9STRA|nr:hypothetical protein THRCLA_21468 [Thraustotheca clavata]